METKTTISFTAEELEVIKSALNYYSLHQIEKSKTWAVEGTFGKEDVYHREANKSDEIWCRCYKAAKRLQEKTTR